METRNKTIIFFGLLLIVGTTLSPFDFTLGKTPLNPRLLLLPRGSETGLEMIANCLLYVPWGFGIGGYLLKEKRASLWTIFTLVLLTSCSISYACEILQLFLPSRFPTWKDVFSNTLGGLLGFLSFVYWQNGTRLVSFSAYVVAAFVLAIYWQQSTNFRNWRQSFPLLVGNEHTGDRPWRGQVFEFYIGNRAVTPGQATEISSIGTFPAPLKESVIAHYRLEKSGEAEGYKDEIGHLPALIRKQPLSSKMTGTTSGIDWFETAGPAAYLTRRLMETSQFTLVTFLETADLYQTGPARIISLSADSGQRNFTLGQRGLDLVFRLRTPLTGENGVNPELNVPNVFSSKKPRQIIVTYDGEDLLVYIDGEIDRHSLQLTPGRALFTTAPSVKPMLAKVLFYAFIFAPAGVLLVRLIATVRPLAANLLIAGGCLALPIALEGLLLAFSGRNAKLGNVLLSIFFMLLTSTAARGMLSYVRNSASRSANSPGNPLEGRNHQVENIR